MTCLSVVSPSQKDSPTESPNAGHSSPPSTRGTCRSGAFRSPRGAAFRGVVRCGEEPLLRGFQKSSRMTARRIVGRMTSVKPAAAKILRVPTWNSSSTTSVLVIVRPPLARRTTQQLRPLRATGLTRIRRGPCRPVYPHCARTWRSPIDDGSTSPPGDAVRSGSDRGGWRGSVSVIGRVVHRRRWAKL